MSTRGAQRVFQYLEIFNIEAVLICYPPSAPRASNPWAHDAKITALKFIHVTRAFFSSSTKRQLPRGTNSQPGDSENASV